MILAETAETPDRLAALERPLARQPSFVRFWAARSLSAVGFQVVSVVIGWQVYALSNSKLQLGFVGLAEFLPMILLTLPAGHIADRYDRRVVVMLCQLVEAACVAVLAWGSWKGWIGVHGIFAIVALVGAARTFESPATSALLPALVLPTLLPQALALSTAAWQTASILGPAAGGFLYAGGPALAYGTTVLLYGLSIALLTGVSYARKPPAREAATLASVFSGFAYIRAHPVVLGAISLDLFAVLLGGATALLPVYAKDILHAGPFALGLLRAAPAVGALAISAWLARKPIRRGAGTLMFGAVAIFGLATILFGVSSSIPLSLFALVVLGASDVVSVVIRGALVQLATPDAMRGRVSAVNSMFIGTSNQLGEFESGVTAAWLGTVPAVVVGGIGTVLVALLWSRLFPQLRRAQTLGRETHG